MENFSQPFYFKVTKMAILKFPFQSRPACTRICAGKLHCFQSLFDFPPRSVACQYNLSRKAAILQLVFLRWRSDCRTLVVDSTKEAFPAKALPPPPVNTELCLGSLFLSAALCLRPFVAYKRRILTSLSLVICLLCGVDRLVVLQPSSMEKEDALTSSNQLKSNGQPAMSQPPPAQGDEKPLQGLPAPSNEHPFKDHRAKYDDLCRSLNLDIETQTAAWNLLGKLTLKPQSDDVRCSFIWRVFDFSKWRPPASTVFSFVTAWWAWNLWNEGFRARQPVNAPLASSSARNEWTKKKLNLCASIQSQRWAAKLRFQFAGISLIKL